MAGSSEQGPIRIDTIQDLQRILGPLLERINGEPALAQAAAANPLLALEELGYELAPAVGAEIEERGRFSKREIVHRRKLREEIRKHAGREVDVTSPEELRRLLVEDLGIDKAQVPKDLSLPKPRRKLLRKIGTTSGVVVGEDPLRSLAGAHRAIQPIVAFRELEASNVRFASPEAYRALRSGARRLPALTLKARPKPETVSTDRPPE